MKTYEYHAIANIFPLMTPEEMAELVQDIKINGLKQEIVLFEDKILDGRNRYQACLTASVEPKFKEYKGNTPYSDVFSLNLQRRHLTAGQKSIVAEEMWPLISAERKKLNRRYVDKDILEIGWSGTAPNKKEKPIEVVSKMFGVSDKSIHFVRKLKKEEPEIYEKVKKGGYTLQDARRNLKVKEHAKKVEKAKANPQSNIFNGPYDLILADCPWKYDFSETVSREIENHYETATVEELIKHKPNSSDNSVLFLWATAPKLLEALEVMKGWGFQYITHAIWDKETIGMGYWFRGQHELLLVGKKGNLECPIETERVSSIFSEKKTQHSKKPECVYKWIEKAFPDKTKLEMYCRTPRNGWSAWGNEI